MDCLFCKIIKGEIPSSKVYEDERVFAFLDIGPINKGHTLVIPKKHVTNIFDIETEDLDALSEAVRKIAPAVKKALDADGVNIMSSNGEAAGQVIMHSHIHIIPRFKGDKGKPVQYLVNNQPTEGISDIAQRIREQLKN